MSEGLKLDIFTVIEQKPAEKEKGLKEPNESASAH